MVIAHTCIELPVISSRFKNTQRLLNKKGNFLLITGYSSGNLFEGLQMRKLMIILMPES
jgi:hypothetical protein